LRVKRGLKLKSERKRIKKETKNAQKIKATEISAKEKDAEEKTWDAVWEAKKRQNEATAEYRKSRGTNEFLDNLQKVQKAADDFIKAHSAWEAEVREKKMRQNIYGPAN